MRARTDWVALGPGAVNILVENLLAWYVRAYDVRNGGVLWETRLTQSAQGYPITYAVDGKQYVAFGVGTGGASWTSMPLQLTPEKSRPVGGNGLFVFALPE